MFVKYPKKDGDTYEKATFYTCLVLYALTSLAISGGVLYLVVCVPQAKLPFFFGSQAPVPVENSLELDSPSTAASLPALDFPVDFPDETSYVDKDDLKMGNGGNGDILVPLMDSIGDTQKTQPPPEILILDLQGDASDSEDKKYFK